MSRASPQFCPARACEEIFRYLHDQNGPAHAETTLNLRCASLVARPSLALVFGVLATAIAIMAALSWLQRIQIDEARSAQVILNQIAVLTREINNLTWTALQKHDLTPEAEIEMRAARQALPKGSAGGTPSCLSHLCLRASLARVRQLHYVG